MGEYNGKINVSKDTMLFVVNSVFKKGIKESTTKENILKMMPEIYENADEKEIIKLLPYKAYNALEDLIEYLKTGDDIHEFSAKHIGVGDLQEAMIIVARAKYLEYNYSLNPGVIEKLKKIFSEENRKLAKRYGEIEKLTIGMLYTYGVVEFEFFRTQLCKYMKEIITEEELYDIFFKRLNLNVFVDYYSIRWENINETQSFLTYLDEEVVDVGDIARGQKARGMRYKQFSKQEILKREEYLWDANAKKIYEFLKNKNDRIWEWNFRRLLKENELGKSILGELPNMCMFEDEIEIRKFMELYMQWYNNSPQYELGGYSPYEFTID